MATLYQCLIGYGAVAIASLATLLAMAYGEDRARQRTARADETRGDADKD